MVFFWGPVGSPDGGPGPEGGKGGVMDGGGSGTWMDGEGEQVPRR